MRFVFFDIDDTLVDQSGATSRAAALFFERCDRCVEENVEDFVATWWRALDENIARYHAGEISFREHRRGRIRDVLRADVDDATADELFAEYLELYQAGWRLFDDVDDCLAAFEKERIGVISNGHGAHQRKKIGRTGLSERFSEILISGEVGCRKPDAEIFEMACARVGVEPGDAVYVGDRFEVDALGAVRAGLRGVWLSRDGSSERTDEGVVTIRSLRELPAVVRA